MITVDFLLAVGFQGGVEKVVNQIGRYMHNTGNIRVRVVQLVWEGGKWVDDSLEFYPLLNGKGNYKLDTFIDSYCDFIEESGRAEIIIATAMPYMSQVARNSLDRMGIADSIIISWPHNLICKYKEGGFGSIENMKYADAHLAISNYIMNEILNGLKGANVIRVNNPVNMDFLEKCLLGQRKLKHQITYIGRLSQEKNVPLIIDALAKTTSNDWKLYVVGDGDIRKALELYAVQKGVLDRINWKGWQNNPWEDEDIIHSDFVVFASEHEGFSVAMIEALAHGIPVISTPVSGATEIIVPGKTGYLFGHGESDYLAKVLDYVEEKKLPLCNSSDCVDIVKNYETNIASNHFTKVILS